jgi:2-methylcitrate dehydratase PrpD
MQTQLEQAAAWIVGLSLSDLPPDVVALARSQQLDIIAAIAAGARTRAGRAIQDAVRRSSEGGKCVALPDATRCTVFDAVYLHATLANALELDNFVFSGHTGQSAVGVPLALGQVLGSSGEQALLAQVAATEIAGRLGTVMTAGPQHGHMKTYMHRLGAAVAAARLMGLGERATANAMAIALSGPEYPLFAASWSADTKVLCTGDPALAGVRAAYLAADGVEPTRDIVEHVLGLVLSLSENRFVPEIWHSLGHTYSLYAICFKPVAACAYGAAAAIATERVVQSVGDAYDVERVRSVEIRSNSVGITLEGFSTPHAAGVLTPTNTNFSMRRTVALTLLNAGVPVGASFVPERFEPQRSKLLELSARTQLVHHWPHTIDLLRGVDQAIDHPGRPGVYGMGEAHKTMARFRRAFGTPGAVTPGDLPALVQLPEIDRNYLLQRYAKGLRARLPFASNAARAAYISRETDLARMQLRLSAGVSVRFDDGRVRSEEVRIPSGFAGDPARERVARDKFVRELSAAHDPEFATEMLTLFDGPELPSPSRVAERWTELCQMRA